MRSVPLVTGDPRALPANVLADLRRRVVAAVETGMAQVDAARLFGVSRQTVGLWVREYRDRGDSAFVPGRRGRRPGEQLALAPAQQLWVARAIMRHTPDAIGLRYRVWTRQAVTELINREFMVMLGATTVGNYLVRWGFPGPQDLLRTLRGRNAVAVSRANRYGGGERQAWLPGAEVIWVGHGSPKWTMDAQGGGWADLSVLQAVSNRGAMSFLACEDPFDAGQVRAYLERLAAHLRRRVNVVVTWLPARGYDRAQSWDIGAAAVRFVDLEEER
ncbi:Transposase [Actinokineospora alba]|uniref:Transposase n=1 Tax=Actinokineospora alba TaxID=504798 RepID=A0A1H0VII0_9PSEU|nr:helix-turn-helix domain-containing protein [Actinokineospora alba]TDP67715.1 transposase [Actinokineospora alba]SDJ27642.1 Transposase [Actinokineospora alba]SDP77995.1 Transposase [Actinokineospora alba]